MIANLLGRLPRLLSKYRETYAWPALALGACWLGIHYVSHLTGRAVIDDPGALVGMLYNFAGLVLVLVLDGLTVSHFIGDAKDTDPAWKHWLELCAHVFFSLLFAHYIFR